MANLPTDPLAAVIAAARKSKPAPRVAPYATRMNAIGPSVLIMDISGSMSATAWSARRKIDILAEAVANISDAVKIAFSSSARILSPTDPVPAPSGTTNLTAAIILAQTLRPSQTLVISDGQPDDAASALAEARSLTGVINALYVGPDADIAAIKFMSELARVGMGQSQTHDMVRSGPNALAATAQKMLPSK